VVSCAVFFGAAVSGFRSAANAAGTSKRRAAVAVVINAFIEISPYIHRM
jgi:hypothetical protein